MSELRENNYSNQSDSLFAAVPQPDQTELQPTTLEEAVTSAVARLFPRVDKGEANDLYDLVLQEVEAPLLESVMTKTAHNQSKAAKLLGLNRGTLRKKLKRYSLI